MERLWSGCGAHKGRACGGGEVPPLRAAPAASPGIEAFNSYVRRVLSRVVERRIGADGGPRRRRSPGRVRDASMTRR